MAGEGENQNWYEGLGDDLKANPTLTKFKDVGALATSYIELEKTLGKDKVVIPTEKDAPEVHAAFWRKLGAPEKEDDYQLSDEDVAEPVRLSADDKKAFQKAALARGIPKQFVEGMFQEFKKMREAKFNQDVERMKNMKGLTEAELRKKHGAAYEAKVAGAQKLIDTFSKDKKFSPEAKAMLLNDQGFLEMLSEISENISEDKFGGSKRTTMTPEEAQTELNSILADRKGPYYNDLHPEHNAIVQKTLDLQALIAAGQAA